MQADCDLIRPTKKRDVYREAAELCYRRRRPRSLEFRSLRLREVVMPKLIRAILFVMAAQQAQAIVVAAQVWSYQFTPTGSRPFESGCDLCSANYLGTRADLAGTFSIVIDWETNTGMLGHVNDRLVNTATIVSSPPGTALVPNNPPDFDHGGSGSTWNL